MTGYYIRARVDGRWESVELDGLPDDALEAWVASLDDAAARRWLLALSRWLGDRVRRAPREDPHPPILGTLSRGERGTLRYLADRVLESGVAGLPPEDARRWLLGLVRYIRDNEPDFGGGPDPPPSFTCPDCGRTSHNPHDALHRYCGACHKFS